MISGLVRPRSDYSSPASYAKALGFDLESPVTSEELLKVFDFRPINPNNIVVELDKSPEKTAGLYVPKHVREDHQTGSPKGRVIWIGKDAADYINQQLKDCGYTEKIQPGDIIGFGVMNPRPAGLSFNGQAIVPGVDFNRWVGISFVHADDVCYHVPGQNLQS